ncbi:MAG: AraC family transcriptional regulator [Saprospiraceae bacterium]
MVLQQKVTNGLDFQINSCSKQLDNNSFLSKSKDGISLSFVFTDLDNKVNVNSPNSTFEIQFNLHNDFLNKFSTDKLEFSSHNFPQFQEHPICCTSQMILHEIVNNKMHDVYRNIFLESKALELLLCFQKCNTTQQNNCDSCKFLTNSIEKEKILKAKEIILNSLNNPPTIPELAMLIGINQCYLKKGFKEIFGTTVYDFVQEQRMLKAKLLLSTTGLSVSKVAECIGYSSQSNFSNAFKKFTGVLPSELNQN